MMTRRTSATIPATPSLPLPAPAERASAHVPHLNRTVLAHRGLPSQAPENTMASFRAAIEAGASWIETDTDLIADGTPIILHDTALDRTTDRTGPLYALTPTDLATVDAGSWYGPAFAGERIPTLAAVIDLLNETGTNANIELKANEEGAARSLALVDALAAELDRLRPGIEVIVSSFSLPLLMTFHQRHPQYAVGVLYEATTIRPDWLSAAELCGAGFLHLEDAGLTREMVETATGAGYGVNVWTVNSPERAAELFSWGATGVFTDVAGDILAIR